MFLIKLLERSLFSSKIRDGLNANEREEAGGEPRVVQLNSLRRNTSEKRFRYFLSSSGVRDTRGSLASVPLFTSSRIFE